MNSKLFSPFQLGPITLPNRVVVAPMCQYSADDGSAGDWHLQHLAQLGHSGAGLIMVEATAIERRGRITHGCLGIYSEDNQAALGRALSLARRFAGPARFGIQLAHAGRKASAHRPWEQGGAPLGSADDAWPTVAPSALPFGEGWHVPAALNESGIARITAAFVAAARSAVRLGFDVIELHAAHGYLLHEFLSPLANRREDGYGGGLEMRMRVPLDVARAVRECVPETVALGMRITGSDWVDDGLTPEDAVVFARELKALGLDYVGVSSGGIAPDIPIPAAPGFQVPLAAKVRAEAGIATRAVGLITEPVQAEAIVADGHADMVALARAFLDDPRWAWHAADALDAAIWCPPQYQRARPPLWSRN